MGLNDAQEMLDAAKDHIRELETENRDLRAELARRDRQLMGFD